MNPVIMSYIGETIRNLPHEVFDVLSLLLLVILLIIVVIGVMGVISSLMDIAMYAVVAGIAIVGFFFLTDYVEVDRAIRIISDVVDLIIGLL